MITGVLANVAQEIQFYPKALQTGLQYLLDTDFSQVVLGRQEIDGDKIYAMVSEYETEAKTVRRPEAHQKYIDIQYIFTGREVIGTAPLTAAGEVTEDLLAQRDAIFYKTLDNEAYHTLTAGMFAIYFPWDVHRPNCFVNMPEKVKKVVVKILLAELTVK
ncbi:MAG: YhcH/YjgK/YiaL family protein [Sporomusaceae bacterium]|nr:YhcH/YjgK/YiaL family protein [Sporomusaceae bacterium]